MPSARRPRQLALLLLCGSIGAGALTGCETTQEKAEKQQVRAAQILKAREGRRQEKKKQREKSQKQDEKGKKG